MNAVQILTGRGGWPMTVFLTPEGKPFYGGTYFPPTERHGMPAFTRVLLAVARAYHEQKDDVRNTVAQLMEGMQRTEAHRASDEPPGADAVVEAAAGLARAYDPDDGGLGQAPKFPNTSPLDLFLRTYDQTGDRRYLDMVLHTLRRMAQGGIYDQLGGGFHRYSVDAHWLVPHFEKMLYDNAQLVPLLLSAYQASGDEFFARIARETLDYVAREMRDGEGGFYSTQDADSEGEEGKFFVWTPKEVEKIVGAEAAEIVCRYWDVSDVGNFEGHNILHVTLDIEQIAKLFRRSPEEVTAILADARAKLFAAREKRVHPGRDDKVLTSWNGLMISAFARAAEVLDEPRYAQVALDAVAFLEKKLERGDRLLSTYKDGVAKLNAYLDDYAFVAAALLDVYEAVQDRRHLEHAERLVGTLLDHFWDADGGGFFFTSDDHEALIVRSKPSFDGSIPSGNSVAAQTLLRLYHLTGKEMYLEPAETVVRLYGTAARQQPFGFANLLCAMDLYARKPFEIVVVAKPDEMSASDLLHRIRSRYLPNRALTVVDPADVGSLPPLLAGKGQKGGKTTVYVCHAMTCSAPATTWDEIEPLLR
jgi:uncharacterized protein YyaL (SSP411 family)